MPSFGPTSIRRLQTCHEDLQKIANELIKEFDFTVCCGYRPYAEQEKAFNEGKSKLHYPDSKHNHLPSLAMDICPYDAKKDQLDWSEDKLNEMMDRVEFIANKLGIKIRLGRDFKTLKDMPHVEI